MDLLPDAQQGALAARARELVAGTAGPDLWAAWAGNGWFDASGGSTLIDHTLRFRELGRALVPGPYLATVLAARVIGGAGAAAVDDSGTSGVAFAQPVGALLSPTRIGGEAGAHIAGRLRIYDRSGSTRVLIPTSMGAALLESDSLPSGESVDCLDPQVEVETTAVEPVRAILWTGSSRSYLEAAVLVAALASGIAEATLEASTEFAKVREQFGKPIGTFQAVKHRCADMAIRAEAAWCQTAYAALCADAGRADAEFQARTAKVVAAGGAILNAGANIQNHGAAGCTVENEAHLHVKRAWVLEQLGGTSREHLAALLECPPPE